MRVASEDGLQVRPDRPYLGQRRRRRVGVPLQYAVGEQLDVVRPDQRVVGETFALLLCRVHHPVPVRLALRRQYAVRIVVLRQRGAHRQHIAPLGLGVEVDRLLGRGRIENAGDACLVEQLPDFLGHLRDILHVEIEERRRVHRLTGVLVDVAVGLAQGIDAYQLACGVEVGGERGPGVAHNLAGRVARPRQRRAVEATVVAVIAEQLDQHAPRGLVKRRPHGGVRRIRLVAVEGIPLTHHQPLAIVDLVAFDAGAHEFSQLRQRLRGALQVANVELHDCGRMDVRIEQPRQDELPTCILHARTLADVGLAPAFEPT